MAKPNQFLVDGLFGFSGRMRRSEYWIAGLALAILRIAMLLAVCNVLRVGMVQAAVMPPVRLGLGLLFLWPHAAITIKRGHDRNRPAQVTGVLLAALYAGGELVTMLEASGERAMHWLVLLLGLPLWLYMLIDYGFADGTRGPNRYGPSPKPDLGLDAATDTGGVKA